MRKAGKQESSAPPPHLLFVWSNRRSSELLFLKSRFEKLKALSPPKGKAGKVDEWPVTPFFLPVFLFDLSGLAQLY